MNWLQLFYEYIMGGIFFAITLFLCIKTGAASYKNADDRRSINYLILGLIGYFLAMTGWIILAGL